MRHSRHRTWHHRLAGGVAVLVALVASMSSLTPASADPTDPLCSPGTTTRLTDRILGVNSASDWVSLTTDPVTGVVYIPYFVGNSNRVASYDIATHTMLTCGVVVGGNLGDTHNGANLHVDALGYLHVVNGRHGQAPIYLRSKQPHDADLSSGFVTPKSLRAANGRLPVPLATYPQLYDNLSDPAQLVVSARKRTPEGHAQVEMSWSTNSGNSWSPAQVVVDMTATHPEAKIYSSLTQADDGTLHLTWSPHKVFSSGPCDTYSNSHIFYARSTDFGHTWTRADGTPLTLPITEAESEVAVQSDDVGVKIQAKQPSPIAFDAAGNPILVYRQWLDTTCTRPNDSRAALLMVTWDGTAWTAPRPVAPDALHYDYVVDQLNGSNAIEVYANRLYGSVPVLVGYTSTDDGATWSDVHCYTAVEAHSISTMQSFNRAGAGEDFVSYASGGSGYFSDVSGGATVPCPQASPPADPAQDATIAASPPD